MGTRQEPEMLGVINGFSSPESTVLASLGEADEVTAVTGTSGGEIGVQHQGRS